jgi:lauroyl/myristoyl acyltransferase
MKAGRPLYYLPDMDFGSRDSIFVPFFGVQAATVPVCRGWRGWQALPSSPA